MLKPYLVFGFCVSATANKSPCFALSCFICVVSPSLFPIDTNCGAVCSSLLLLFSLVDVADVAFNSDAVIALDTIPVVGVDIALAFPPYISSFTGEDIASVTCTYFASVTDMDICVGIAWVVGEDIGSDECVGNAGTNSSRTVPVVCPVDKMLDSMTNRFSAVLDSQSWTPWLAVKASILFLIVSSCRWRPAWILSISPSRPHNVDTSANNKYKTSANYFRNERIMIRAANSVA